jgi:hypothetical protein
VLPSLFDRLSGLTDSVVEYITVFDCAREVFPAQSPRDSACTPFPAEPQIARQTQATKSAWTTRNHISRSIRAASHTNRTISPVPDHARTPLQMPCQTLSTSKSASGRSTHPETPLHVSCILHAYATCNVTQRTRMNPENLTTHHDHISKLSLNMNELTHRLFYHHRDCR